MSSGSLHHSRMVARSTGFFGLSGGFGNTSSRYMQITLDSTMVLPSWTSTGTTPRGFIFLNSGVSCSPRARLRWWLVHGRFFSAENDADLLRAH